jgi:hypothetical protein
MKYTTTRCPYCGNVTRNNESGVPSVQLGVPVIKCNKCSQYMLDPIQTEFEFMTDTQKNSFNSNVASRRGIAGNLIFIIAGVLFIIGSLSAEGEYVAITIVIGSLLLLMGVGQMIGNNKVIKEKTLEKEVYRSLIRRSNSDYVDFLSRLYRGSKSKKDYTVYKDKSYFISANKDLISINEIENIKNEVGSYMAEILNNEIKDSTIMETHHH